MTEHRQRKTPAFNSSETAKMMYLGNAIKAESGKHWADSRFKDCIFKSQTCPICTGIDFAEYAWWTGLPEDLLRLEYEICSKTEVGWREEFSVKFILAIPIGFDLSNVAYELALSVITDEKLGLLKYNERKTLNERMLDTVALLRARCHNPAEWAFATNRWTYLFDDIHYPADAAQMRRAITAINDYFGGRTSSLVDCMNVSARLVIGKNTCGKRDHKSECLHFTPQYYTWLGQALLKAIAVRKRPPSQQA